MSRIQTPQDVNSAPTASIPLLESVQAQLGSVPNMFRIISNSPAALEGFLKLSDALGKGALDAATRERIALAVAEVNGCDYCIAAHTYIGSNVANLSDIEIEANRRGFSTSPKASAAVLFAVDIAISRGRVSSSAIQAVRDAGYSDAEIVEIVAHVALNTLTNYINVVLGTEVDFPQTSALAA